MLCDKKTSIISGSGLALLVSGACVFGAGIHTLTPAATYSGIGIMSTGLVSIVYLLCTLRRHSPKTEFPVPHFPPYVYTTPGMKRNKSDTSLELMSSVGSPKTDERGRVLSLSLV
jgi:hypothetical protein